MFKGSTVIVLPFLFLEPTLQVFKISLLRSILSRNPDKYNMNVRIVAELPVLERSHFCNLRNNPKCKTQYQ